MILITIIISLVSVAAVFILAIILFGYWASNQPAVKNGYFNNINSKMPIESKYSNKGDYHVSYFEQQSKDDAIKKFEIWYPSELSMNKPSIKKFPLVIMVNGSGIIASKYKPIFDHLASWGFIVVGNEDERSGSGDSSSASLEFMLTLNSTKDSQFYDKIDLYNIGIAGHSQGGLGSINAVTLHDNGDIYKVIYTASAPSYEIAKEVLNIPYDLSNLGIPYFQTAGTLRFDAGIDENSGISPLSSMVEKYKSISDEVPKVLARRLNADHADMLTNGDGYMTAWFMYWLQDDLDAKRAFFGKNAEILYNPNWTNIGKNI